MSEDNKRFDLYMAPGYSLNEFVETNASFGGISLGITYKKRLDLSFSFSAILDSFKKQIIFPSTHKYDQKNFGIRGQYSFFNTRIRPNTGLAYKYCRAYWNPLNDSNETFDNNFSMYEFFIGADWFVSEVFSLNVSGGYNMAGGIDLVGLSDKDYHGFVLNLMFRVRLLKF